MAPSCGACCGSAQNHLPSIFASLKVATPIFRLARHLEVFAEQEHAILVVFPDALKEVHAIEIGLGRDQARDDDLVEAIFCR